MLTEQIRSSAVDALFQPLHIRGCTLRNRIVMSPMTRNFAPDGLIGEASVEYYRRRAEGEVGLIVTEGVGIDHPGAIGRGTMGEDDMPLLHGAASLARWRKVVEAVHEAGGIIFPQLWHQGVIRQEGTGPFPDAPSMRPSGIWGPVGSNTALPDYLEMVQRPTRPMTDEEIADVIDGFGRAARNAREAGFDGIAIHGAHGYLLDSFFWHGTNLRDDLWGGPSLNDRVRFGVEVVRAIRAEAGDLPIMMRYSQWKQQDYDGWLARDPDELEGFVGALADAGVDLFDASTRYYHRPAFEGSPLTLAGWTRKLSGKPTMAVGGIGLAKELKESFAGPVEVVDNLPDVAQRIEQGEFELAGVGRSLIADPQWVLKVKAGETFIPFSPECLSQLV